MSNIESIESAGYQIEINADVRDLFKEYRKIFYWDLQDIDENVADKFILVEMRKALDDIESKLLLSEHSLFQLSNSHQQEV